MTQTLEEKRARRKARKEKRKLAKSGVQVVQPKVVVPTKTPDTDKEKKSLYPVRVPYKPIAGITFVRFKGSDSAYPDCYRIYSGIHFLGIVHANPGTKKCRVSQPESLSKAKRDPRAGPKTFDIADEAIQFLIANYYRSL